ncbi:MAG: 5-(carboxyamino)imidazole ribonucleotide mutase [Christensenellaceae bacterium]|jgi:5-(carboxyamino)imidazole ribonucleotide mutase|nr:5-(carboxyamino)imidazole ribonucleotide mutase [Christensenellaceae bacterium]
MNKVAIIMGSKSDLPVLKDAYDLLKTFGIEVETRVMSAHRTPDAVIKFSACAKDNGFDVIIAAAGKAAHLAGVIAAHTSMPVIGIPIKSSFMDGLDSLLSTVQMPTGVPVATVGVNAAGNAALIALQILAVNDSKLYNKLVGYKELLKVSVERDDVDVSNQYK